MALEKKLHHHRSPDLAKLFWARKKHKLCKFSCNNMWWELPVKFFLHFFLRTLLHTLAALYVGLIADFFDLWTNGLFYLKSSSLSALHIMRIFRLRNGIPKSLLVLLQLIHAHVLVTISTLLKSSNVLQMHLMIFSSIFGNSFSTCLAKVAL